MTDDKKFLVDYWGLWEDRGPDPGYEHRADLSSKTVKVWERVDTGKGRPHGDSCFCTMCAMLFTGGTFNDYWDFKLLDQLAPKKGELGYDPSLQRPQESPEEAEEAPAGQAEDDSPPPPGAINYRPRPFPDIRVHLHPHTDCPQCQHDAKDPEPGDPELEALIAAMRTSAQETLTALHRHGWKIVKA